MMGVAIQLEHVSKTYKQSNVLAVDDLSLTIERGHLVTLLGPSGCGKSTTLRITAGLETPDHGNLYIGDRAMVLTEKRLVVPAEDRDIGMVFQSYAIWPHMTVGENVAFPLKVRRVERSEMRRRVEEALALVGMSGTADRPAPLLSGGQQQRVALARAMVTGTRVLLLDEPFSNLDAKLREQMRVELKLLQKRAGITVLFVTHDQTEALNLSDRIILMAEGRVQQEGSPRDLYERPTNEFVRDFVGRTALFDGVLEAIADDNAVVVMAGSPGWKVRVRQSASGVLKPGDRAHVAVRPEHVHICPDEASLKAGVRGMVEAALFAGDRMEYQVRLADGVSVFGCGSPRTPLLEGDHVLVSFPEAEATVWPISRQRPK